MPASAFALVVVAGLIHSLWNIAAKKAGGDARFACFTSMLQLIVWAPIGIYAGLGVLDAWNGWMWAVVGLSGMLHVLYFIVLLRGYRKADLTVVYPLARGTGPLLSSLTAIVLFGEAATLSGLLGIAAVIGGVFLIAGGAGFWRVAHDSVKRERLHKGMRYGVLTGVFIAAYTVLDGYAVKMLLLSPILVDYCGNITRIPLLLPAVLRNRTEAAALWRTQWKYALIVAAVSPLSYVMVLYALRVAPLSHVAPAREVSMLFAALIGGHLLGEGDRVPRVLGALCIAAGVIALAH